MSYVIFLPVMTWPIADMAYQFTYSSWSQERTKHTGFCEEGDELSRMTLHIPKRPMVEGWKSIFYNTWGDNNRNLNTFSFCAPFKGSIIYNADPCSGDTWWYDTKRPLPDSSKDGLRNAGFNTAILIDRMIEYRGIGIYSEMFNWFRRNSEFLEEIAKKSSGYMPEWKNILEKEIKYLSSTICPVIPYDEYKNL